MSSIRDSLVGAIGRHSNARDMRKALNSIISFASPELQGKLKEIKELKRCVDMKAQLQNLVDNFNFETRKVEDPSPMNDKDFEKEAFVEMPQIKKPGKTFYQPSASNIKVNPKIESIGEGEDIAPDGKIAYDKFWANYTEDKNAEVNKPHPKDQVHVDTSASTTFEEQFKRLWPEEFGDDSSEHVFENLNGREVKEKLEKLGMDKTKVKFLDMMNDNINVRDFTDRRRVIDETIDSDFFYLSGGLMNRIECFNCLKHDKDKNQPKLVNKEEIGICRSTREPTGLASDTSKWMDMCETDLDWNDEVPMVDRLFYDMAIMTLMPKGVNVSISKGLGLHIESRASGFSFEGTNRVTHLIEKSCGSDDPRLKLFDVDIFTCGDYGRSLITLPGSHVRNESLHDDLMVIQLIQYQRSTKNDISDKVQYMKDNDIEQFKRYVKFSDYDSDKLEEERRKINKQWIKSDRVYRWVQGGEHANITANIFEVLYALNLHRETVRYIEKRKIKEYIKNKYAETDNETLISKGDQRILCKALKTIDQTIHHYCHGDGIESHFALFHLGIAINCFSADLRTELIDHFWKSNLLTSHARNNYDKISASGIRSFNMLKKILNTFLPPEQLDNVREILDVIGKSKKVCEMTIADKFTIEDLTTNSNKYTSLADCAIDITRVLRIIAKVPLYAMVKTRCEYDDTIRILQRDLASVKKSLKEFKLGCSNSKTGKLYTILDALEIVKNRITKYGVKFTELYEGRDPKILYQFTDFNVDYRSSMTFQKQMGNDEFIDPYFNKEQYDEEQRLLKLFDELQLNGLCSGNKRLSDDIYNCICLLIQNPGMLLQIVPVIIGEQGCGKSTWANIICSMLIGFCEPNISDAAHVTGQFNEILEGKILVILNELRSKKGNKNLDEDQLKSFTTEDKIMINAKFQSVKTIVNMCNFILITNHLNSMIIEVNDRRNLPIIFSNYYLGKYEFFEQFYVKEGNRSIRTSKTLNPLLIKALLARCLAHKIPENFDPTTIRPTEVKITMQLLSLEPYQRCILEFWDELNGKKGILASEFEEKAVAYIDFLRRSQPQKYGRSDHLTIIGEVKTRCEHEYKDGENGGKIPNGLKQYRYNGRKQPVYKLDPVIAPKYAILAEKYTRTYNLKSEEDEEKPEELDKSELEERLNDLEDRKKVMLEELNREIALYSELLKKKQ